MRPCIKQYLLRYFKPLKMQMTLHKSKIRCNQIGKEICYGCFIKGSQTAKESRENENLGQKLDVCQKDLSQGFIPNTLKQIKVKRVL